MMMVMMARSSISISTNDICFALFVFFTGGGSSTLVDGVSSSLSSADSGRGGAPAALVVLDTIITPLDLGKRFEVIIIDQLKSGRCRRFQKWMINRLCVFLYGKERRGKKRVVRSTVLLVPELFHAKVVDLRRFLRQYENRIIHWKPKLYEFYGNDRTIRWRPRFSIPTSSPQYVLLSSHSPDACSAFWKCSSLCACNSKLTVKLTAGTKKRFETAIMRGRVFNLAGDHKRTCIIT